MWDMIFLWELPSRWAKFCEILSHSVRYVMYGGGKEAFKPVLNSPVGTLPICLLTIGFCCTQSLICDKTNDQGTSYFYVFLTCGDWQDYQPG